MTYRYYNEKATAEQWPKMVEHSRIELLTS